MFKVEAKLNKKHRLEAENILFETALAIDAFSESEDKRFKKLEGIRE